MNRAQRIREEAAQAEAALLSLAQGAAPATAADTPAGNDAPVDSAPATEASSEPAPTVEAAPVSAVEKDYRELEHKYNTLQGMFAKQGADVGALRQQVEALLQRAAQAPAQSSTQAPLITGKFTAKDREEYGDQLLDLIRRGAQDAMSVATQALTARLDRLEKALNETAATATSAVKTAAEVAREKFYVRLAELHSDWEMINDSPEWLTWLSKADSMSGMRRDDLLQDAYRSLDVARTAAFFAEFKRETGKSGTAPGGAKSDAGRIDPRSLVAPATAASPSPNPNPSRQRGRIWTMAEVNKLYDDYSKGKINRAEFLPLEADIHLAATENRVQP